MSLPEDFFTTSTLFTLSGLASAVWIITSVIGYLFELKNSQKFKKWIGLVLSLTFVLLGATLIKERTMLTWVVAVVNGFLVFLTSVGINTVASKRPLKVEIRQQPTRDARAAEKKERGKFRDSWL
jgi:thiol:disulfide interchange protein